MSARDMFFEEGTEFSKTEERAFAREALVYMVTEDILIMMEDKNITKVELARKLGKSKSYVTRLLSGSRNMTLGTLSDICFALEVKPEVLLPVQLPEKPDKKATWTPVEPTVKTVPYKKEANVYTVRESHWQNSKVA